MMQENLQVEIEVNQMKLSIDPRQYKIETKYKCWQSDKDFIPYIQLKDESRVLLTDFEDIQITPYHSGTYQGVYITYQKARNTSASLRTFYLIDTTTNELMLRLMTLQEDDNIQEIAWPSPLETHDGYSVLPYRQGILLPHDEKMSLKLPFNGQFCSAAAYLSMLGSVEKDGAVLMINETPWDSRYEVKQLFGKEETRLQFIQLPSLGKMRYRRDLRYVFFANGDYNTLAKYYRGYLKEKGHLRSLKEKTVALPQIEELVKCSFVHTGIKTYVQPTSRFYEANNPEKNNHLTSFAQRANELETYQKMGMKHLYLHLDGWGIAYDNGHPDVMPINEQAGGIEGMKALETKAHELGYLFGIHDQYRDYYHLAKTYNREFALQDVSGNRYEHANWAGGVQNYLCASVAKDYVKRNFEKLKGYDIGLDGAYLDVFTCNELDECANVNHLMTRKDCAMYREQCFQYLVANQIMPSSEEVNEWAMNTLVFCHYAPYEFQMYENGKAAGIGIPLFNLVYHDCVVIPWMMDKPSDDYMLYALLNGGAPYFKRDAAYPNIDGAFTKGLVPLEQQKKRCEIVSQFHQKVAGVEMVSHEFIDDTFRKQKTVFKNGMAVMIDLDQGTYEIVSK